MAEYRVYVIGSEGRILSVVELVCPNDDAAKEEAKELVDRDDLAIWKGKRNLAKFKLRQWLNGRYGARSQKTGKNDRSRVDAELRNEVAKSSTKSNRASFGPPRITARSMRNE